MDISVGDKVQMKKKHPCGNDIFTVKRVGIDFKLVCCGCSHEIMLPRITAEKNIKRIFKQDGE